MIKLSGQKTKENREREIYFRFAEKMLITCMRYLGNIMDAEEVLHNGFMKVFVNLEKYEDRHEKSFECWIRKIMLNECLMLLRKRVNFKLVSVDEVNENELVNPVFPDNDDAEMYWNLISSLPVGYRTVFNLFAIEEYSHKEIAEILDITESTSRSQLTKARKLLQQKLRKQDDSLYA